MRWLALFVVGGCGRIPGTPAAAIVAAPAPATTTRVAPVIFAVPNETMEFRASLRGITVGIVQTAIGTPGWVDGKRALIVKSRGRTDGIISILGDITWELTTTIDLDRGYPIDDREESWFALAGKHEHEDDHQTWNDDDRRHDVHSAIGALRGLHSRIGEETEVDVGVGGAHLTLGIHDAGHDTAAKTPAIRYDGIAHEEFHFSLWLSDDTARVPLAFRTESKLGTIAMELVDYQVPRD